MSALADLLFYFAIALCCLGVALNLKYVLTLPGRVPRDARWAAMVWLVMLFGLGNWLGRSSGTAGAVSIDASSMLQIASIAIAGLIMLLMASRSFDIRNLRFPFIMLLMFSTVGVLTSPVSVYPALFLFKAASVIVAVVLAVMATKPLINAKYPELLFNLVYVYFALLSFLAMLGGLLAPDATHMASAGVFGFMLRGWPDLGPNTLSYVGAVVFVISLRRMLSVQQLRRKMLYLGLGSAGAITLVLSQGRTSIISALIAVLFMAFFVREMRPFRYAIVGTSAFFLALFTLTGSVGDWIDGFSEYMRRGVDDQQLETMSGRIGAWSTSWNLFLKSPILGHGFYATGKSILAPHNAYLTVLLNGGILGFMPWLLGVVVGFWVIFSRFLRRSWRQYSAQNAYYMEILAVMIVQFFRTITGQDITIHSYSMLLFLSVLVYIYARERAGMNRAVTGRADLVTPSVAMECDDGAPGKARILRPKRDGRIGMGG
ncbi:MAG: O-antigen ligase family protein [Gammaproteobacteria bacterium]|nr:O-antigen ligase family protein [Gammaproteobacteria bacterium]